MTNISLVSVLKQPTNSNTSLDVLSQLDIVLNCFLIHLLSLLGVLTNTFNIIVLSKHSFQETTNILLFSLSVCDLMCSILQPFRKINCFAERFNPILGLTVKSFIRAYVFVLPDLFIAVSVLHTTLIAVERLVAVFFPLHVSRIFRPCGVKWTIAFLYVYAIAMLLPTVFLFDFKMIFDSKYNATRGALALSSFYLDNYQTLNGYAGVGVSTVFTVAPLLVIIGCSSATGDKITIGRSKSLTAMASLVTSKNRTGELKVIKMLLTVCAVNAAVALPTVVINMWLLMSDSLFISSEQLLYVMRSAISVIYQVNVTVNFVIYVSMSSKFANTLSRTVFVGCGRKLKGNNNNTQKRI